VAAFRVADANGDGNADLIGVEQYPPSYDHDTVTIHTGHASASQFDPPQSFAVFGNQANYSNPPRIAVGDLNNDGKPDIVTSGIECGSTTCSNDLTVLLNSTTTGAGSGPAATATALSSSANPSSTGQHVTYTATVHPKPDGASVRFADHGKTIAGCGAVAVNAANGTASCHATYATPGTHRVQAAYAGDPQFSSSQSPTLTQTVRWSVTIHHFPTGSSGVVRIILGCASGSGGCHITGSLTVTEIVQGKRVLAVSARARRRHRTVLVGTTVLTVKAGKTATITIKLNPTGRELLARFKTLRVKLTISLTVNGKRSTVAITSVTVKTTRR
jgi:Bacterial Ig-like domain (group 3)/FG-GAP-like repeat